MAKRRPAGARNEMIHCEYCGEDYAATYKRCPFCDGHPPLEDGAEEGEGRQGGKRLVTNTRGGGYGGGGNSPLRIVGTVISLALIVAAVCIIFTLIMPLVNLGNTETIDPDTAPTPTPVSETSQAPASPGPEVSTAPSAAVPADQTATGFTLDQSEFSFSDRYPNPVQINVTFTPSGSTGTITWTSADPEVASVDENGLVSPGSRQGNTTITASLPGAPDQSCVVRNGVTSASAASGSSGSAGQSSSTGSLSLNHTDFSFGSTGDPAVQMRVSGTSSTPVWSIGDTSVAAISSSGVVTPVGSGTTTITCTVDGQTLTCIVRCQF